jgi:thioredoxin 1
MRAFAALSLKKNLKDYIMTNSVNDAQFEAEVLQADSPVLVDFWAEWCGPCKALSPVIDEVAASMQGKVKVVKVNIDEAPEAPTKYGVRGIPTLMIFKNGQVVDTRVGGLPKGQLEDWIKKAI